MNKRDLTARQDPHPWLSRGASMLDVEPDVGKVIAALVDRAWRVTIRPSTEGTYLVEIYQAGFGGRSYGAVDKTLEQAVGRALLKLEHG